MFVNNEITERGRLHRLMDDVADEVAMDERMLWARSIDGAIKEAAAPAIPFRSPLARPVVVLGAAPALAAVAAELRNEDVVVPRAAIEAVRAFMSDGASSPLYGLDPLAARRGADLLRRRLAGGGAPRGAPARSAV
jgi:hypothetical protein